MVLRQHVGLQRAEDEAENLLVQLGRVFKIAAENVRDEAEDRLEYVRHQEPAVVRRDKIPAETGLELEALFEKLTGGVV